ncbi:MAG: epoxyqueuosine reductase QueH [Acutalibacteraceae bacterium]|nr:epoxyqueuosine reductase QueH [Acutalibacteraceae bacterium]
MNYQLSLDKTIEEITANGARKSLLLQACCAPCSSYVLEYLSDYFDITLLFYNPNISPESEYSFRANELVRLCNELPLTFKPKIVVCDYDNTPFFKMAKGLENLNEGGERCFLCYRLRLEETAKYAKAQNFDYFCTTLSISPHKNAVKLNEIGGELSEKYGVKYLYSDFKKKNGYKRSIELSKQYNLYRQNYCGCIYSKREAEKRE